jgi:hypothetical protein
MAYGPKSRKQMATFKNSPIEKVSDGTQQLGHRLPNATLPLEVAT